MTSRTSAYLNPLKKKLSAVITHLRMNETYSGYPDIYPCPAIYLRQSNQIELYFESTAQLSP